MVDKLKENQIFVFGSNRAGFHGGGAASFAYRNFGAEWGVGIGRTGQTYAIPTMNGDDLFKESAAEFIKYATQHPELEFLLTPIGTGIAGYDFNFVNELFKELPKNVIKVGGWQ